MMSARTNSATPDHFLSLFQLPILVYYPRDRKGLQYGGPLSADHIMRFILNAYQPVVTNVHSRDQLLELLAAYGGQGLVGSFTHLQGTSSGSSPGLSYRRFLHAAYVSLEYDAFRELGPWVVVTSPLLAYNLHLNQVCFCTRHLSLHSLE